MLNYNHLHYFHVAATEGSVARAAERLGVTQPTVSEQIRALERALDVSLFDRTPGGLKLTEAGKLAYEHTSVMFRAGERLIETLGGGGRSLPRALRVGLSSSVARSTSTDFLLPLLALEACVPTIRTGNAVDLVRELRDAELDLALVETEPVEGARAGLQLAPIDTISLVAIAPQALVPTPDWQNVALVHYRATSGYRWEVEAYLDQHGLRPSIAAEADDPMFLLEAVVRGGFVAFVPRTMVREHARSVQVLAEIPSTHAAVYALYGDGTSAELARRAVEVLVEYARALRTA